MSIPTGKFVASDACMALAIHSFDELSQSARTLAGNNEMIRVLGDAGLTEDFKYKIFVQHTHLS